MYQSRHQSSRASTRPYPFQGGLDMSTSAVMMPAGRLIACKNYEGVARGYGRMQGYERYDGHPKPSEATYWLISFDAGTAAITAGQVVTGATSLATGKALIDAVVTSGTYGGGTAVGYLVLTGVSGTFQDNEALQVAAVTKVTANGTASRRGSTSVSLDTTWARLAVSFARSQITVVPGAGNILGVWAYNGVVYAVRNFTGLAEARMYKSTAAGWVQVALGFTVPFTSSGSTAIAVGNTITGATSAAAAVVTSVAIRTGSWAAGSAVGTITFASFSAGGPFSNGENLQVGGVTRAVASAASSATTLLPSGRFEFVNNNFGGSTSTYRMYGCDGVNKAFEFDGTTFVPIATGMTDDTPKHIRVHRKHLFLAFKKGSLQHSSIGNPYAWTPVTGAGEIGMGQEITGLVGPYAQNMIVMCKSQIGILYGSDTDTFELVPQQEEAGGLDWTAQIVGEPIFFDDMGLRSLSSTNRTGDFSIGTLTHYIQKWLDKKKKDGVYPVASVRVKVKSQYRVFFSDNSFISVFFGREIVKGIPECFVGDLGKLVTCTSSAELTESGDEVVLFGSTDGYVYQAEAGTSFDGDAISAYFRTAYCNDRSPVLNKAWKKATMEMDTDPGAEIAGSAEFGYANYEQPPNVEQTFEVSGGGMIWDADGTWDINFWDGADVGIADMTLEGAGVNVSIAVISNTAYENPHVAHGVTYQWSPRGVKR